VEIEYRKGKKEEAQTIAESMLKRAITQLAPENIASVVRKAIAKDKGLETTLLDVFKPEVGGFVFKEKT